MAARDAFEENKYNVVDTIKQLIGKTLIVSYGVIDSIGMDTVVVLLSVTDQMYSEKVRCTFLNFGSNLFALSVEPQLGMKVIVFAPQKGMDGMFDVGEQLDIAGGKSYISTPNPSIYSPQFAFCIPYAPSLTDSYNTIDVDRENIVLSLSAQVISEYNNLVQRTYQTDTVEEYIEGEHTRGYYNSLWENHFGFEEGVEGTEEEGEYKFIDIYGSHTQVEKHYLSGADITIGKSFETPFAEDKGAEVDTEAPVTVTVGGLAPVTFETGSKIEINLKGDAEFIITAEEGKFTISNNNSSLKDVLLKIQELYEAINTIGGPAAQSLHPSLVSQSQSELTPLIEDLLE